VGTSSRVTQSMCRTITADGREQSACVACQAPCIDIDAERAFWQTLRGKRSLAWAWFSYPGLILAFFLLMEQVGVGTDLAAHPLGYLRSENVRSAADGLYDRLMAAGIDVILDDRDERPGAMFADWELIGVPLRVTIGERGLKDGQVELTVRRGLKTSLVPLAGAFDAVKDTLEAC
jgi:hypothetical protein